MRLTLAGHPVTDIRLARSTGIEGTVLMVDPEELRRVALEDDALTGMEFEIVRPGESCRAAPVFDIMEPRAKGANSSPDFPGILGAPETAGMGTTHVLQGAVLTLVAEKSPGESRGVTGRLLEMSGAAAEGSKYSTLHHLVAVPHTRGGLSPQNVGRVYRRAGLRLAVHLARSAAHQPPASTRQFDAVGPAEPGREGLPRVAYVGQIFSRQRKPGVDEPILYGLNTEGMLPIPLHPDEWLDGAIVPSYNTSIGGAETYFYQNHPVILELYRRHQARELNFVGTVVTIAGSDNFDRDRNCRAAANFVRWTLKADAAILTKYGGGVPHADLAETARLLEVTGIKTTVMVSDMARDRRVESALLFNFPEVDAIVYNGGHGTNYTLGPVDRIIAATPEMREVLSTPREVAAANVAGVTNQQGASRMRALVT